MYVSDVLNRSLELQFVWLLKHSISGHVSDPLVQREEGGLPLCV